jgi:hypothetical protein
VSPGPSLGSDMWEVAHNGAEWGKQGKRLTGALRVPVPHALFLRGGLHLWGQEGSGGGAMFP